MFRSRCNRPQRKSDSIEYHISASQISFLLVSSSSQRVTSTPTKSSPYSHSILFTFPFNATLKLILSEENFINSAAKYSSTPPTTNNDNTAHFELEGKIVDDNLQFSSIILKNALVLVINENIQLKFQQSRRLVPDSATLHEHRKSLVQRLPINNGHRPKSDEQHDYPNNSLDLLFDTLHGELSYLTEYIKSHIGKRHEFTIYPIQQQRLSQAKQWNEWETGIYKMRGDLNGTVNIALASDWYLYIFLVI